MNQSPREETLVALDSVFQHVNRTSNHELEFIIKQCLEMNLLSSELSFFFSSEESFASSHCVGRRNSY